MINATNLLPLLPPASVSISRIQSGVYVAVVIVGALLISVGLLICITSAGRVHKRRQLQAGGLVLWTRKNFELFWSKLTHSTFWMLSILPVRVKPVELSRENETTLFPIESKRPICVSTKIWLLLGKLGLETRMFGNGTASIGRTGPTGPKRPTLEVTTSTGKFPGGPKFPIILV